MDDFVEVVLYMWGSYNQSLKPKLRIAKTAKFKSQFASPIPKQIIGYHLTKNHQQKFSCPVTHLLPWWMSEEAIR